MQSRIDFGCIARIPPTGSGKKNRHLADSAGFAFNNGCEFRQRVTSRRREQHSTQTL
jgi:hypothetical protein